MPIDGSPVGLVSWFSVDGPVAVLASWLAIINGQPPEMRAGCSGRRPGLHDLPAGTDFTVNIPVDPPLPQLGRLIAKAAVSPLVTIDDASSLVPARSVHAPLLAGCALQLECAQGRLVTGGWDAELAGEILLLHRGGLFLDPAAYPDFCALQPLHTTLLS